MGGHDNGNRHHNGIRHQVDSGHQLRDERVEQLRAEITRLVTDATDETRSATYRDWCARRVPQVQALLFARTDRLDRDHHDHTPRDADGVWGPGIVGAGCDRGTRHADGRDR